MKILTAEIEIGRYTFTHVNQVKIEKSVDVLGSRATIKIPQTAWLVSKGNKTNAVETARQFKPGDFVTIKLGYDGQLHEEFFGFVKRINFTTPVEVECEDWVYMLKRRKYTRSWKQTTLAEVLQYLIAGVGVTLNANVPDVTFDNFQIDTNGADALQKIKDEYGLTVYFHHDELYAGLAYAIERGRVKYELRRNVIEDNELKWRRADDVEISVKAICVKKDNTKIEAEVGDKDGEKRTLFFYDVQSAAELEMLAKEELQKYKYDGYEGKITTFLQPFADIAYVAELTDPVYAERGGNYWVHTVEVTYGTSGVRRIVHLGIKI